MSPQPDVKTSFISSFRTAWSHTDLMQLILGGILFFSSVLWFIHGLYMLTIFNSWTSSQRTPSYTLANMFCPDFWQICFEHDFNWNGECSSVCFQAEKIAFSAHFLDLLCVTMCERNLNTDPTCVIKIPKWSIWSAQHRCSVRPNRDCVLGSQAEACASSRSRYN